MPIAIRTFDQILNGILIDYQNQIPDIDISQGTLTYIKAAVLASTIWNLERMQKYIADERWPDGTSRAALERWCSIYGVARNSGEGDASLLSRLLSRIQQPPAGGNRYDWPRWAKEVSVQHTTNDTTFTELVQNAYVYENLRGSGTVTVVITADLSNAPAWVSGVAYSEGEFVVYNSKPYLCIQTHSTAQIPASSEDYWEDYEQGASDDLLEEITDYLDTRRPLGVWDYIVVAPVRKTQSVSMQIFGTEAVEDVIRDEIESYMKNIEPGKPLYRSQLVAIAVENGADNAVVNSPFEDVTCEAGPLIFERIWPGTLTVVSV
jgi:uncharacterized phage protein gp47/JayE